MKLAILGTDTNTLQLVSVAQNEQHEIVWIGDVRPEDTAAICSITPSLIDQGDNWELLLDRATADAVLIGRGTATSDLRDEQVKRLVSIGMPLLVVHPAFSSVLTYYEIDMTRRESGSIVQHYNPLIAHPFTAELARWVRDGHSTIGAIHQISCEHHAATLTRDELLAYLARDVELLAAVAGDIRRVTAIGPKLDDTSFASLQLQIITTEVSSVRWSASYAESESAVLDITLHGQRGTAIIHILQPSSLDPTWQLETSEQGARNNVSVEPYHPADVAIRRLADAIEASPNSGESNANSTWDSATKAMEVVDGAMLSLQKGRTIEILQQQLTEQLAFRGTMAALGCGLLLVAFFILVGIGLLGGIEGIERPQLANSWPLLLFALLAFFLLLQAVPFLAGKSKRGQNESPKASVKKT